MADLSCLDIMMAQTIWRNRGGICSRVCRVSWGFLTLSSVRVCSAAKVVINPVHHRHANIYTKSEWESHADGACMLYVCIYTRYIHRYLIMNIRVPPQPPNTIAQAAHELAALPPWRTPPTRELHPTSLGSVHLDVTLRHVLGATPENFEACKISHGAPPGHDGGAAARRAAEVPAMKSLVAQNGYLPFRRKGHVGQVSQTREDIKVGAGEADAVALVVVDYLLVATTCRMRCLNLASKQVSTSMTVCDALRAVSFSSGVQQSRSLPWVFYPTILTVNALGFARR